MELYNIGELKNNTIQINLKNYKILHIWIYRDIIKTANVGQLSEINDLLLGEIFVSTERWYLQR